MKKYDIEVLNDSFIGLKHQQTIYENELQQRLTELVPDCNINYKMVFTDKRCRYFRHYMPANITVAKHAYKKNNELHRQRNLVKVYISENFL